ncbi:hypothetical protein F8388_008002 [Cannabis sativa]|uniref:Transposase Tnp1/En/Spm-like domain-containing protein n=1 Tax=Cannabis sativa TaxID=3483 RepID=A0A7J6H8X2_CANSA|nr:hypothetical protein F8388_008002 [Cannabis sativa]
MFAAMDRYMQYRLAEQDEDSVESFTDLLTNNNDKKNGRGPTQMRDIWGNRDGKKIQITCNKFGQPHDKNASRLANLIGTLVRDGKNAPINYENWHKVPDKYKVTMWRIIQEQKKYKDKRVYDKQWEQLINYWATDDAKSATNKASRAKKIYNHTTGTKSFAQIRSAEKESGGSTPTRVAMFSLCYTKKYKSVMDETTQETMVKLQEKEEINGDISKEKSMNDTYSEIMGKERYGSVRTYGFGVCPSDVWENKSSKKRNQSKYIEALESELKELRSKVQNDNVDNTLTILDNFLKLNVKRACTSHNKEPRRQLLFSCSSYDTPVVEVGEVVNHKSITNDPKTIAIALVISKDSSKQVGGKELGDFYSEVIVQVPIKCDKQLIRAYRQFKKISEVVGVPIAWPTDFLISEESHTQLDDSIM